MEDEATWLPRLRGGLDPLSQSWQATSTMTGRAAVLILLDDRAVPDVVFTVRATTLSHHPGQVSLPGGHREFDDESPMATALRETEEEIGLDAHRVRVLGQLPTREVAVSQNLVIPVVGLWSGTDPISAADTAEVDAVLRWSMADLADPSRRVTARHPAGGTGPAWQMDDLFLWGITGYMVEALLRAGGWELTWDRTRIVDVPKRFRRS